MKVKSEYDLHECWVNRASHGQGLQLFRAPIINDGSGDYRRLPHKITWEDLSVGDLVFVIGIHSFPDRAEVIDTLQFWHVLEREGEEDFRIRINNFVGMAADGEFVYDRMAEMLGLPPCSPDRG